MNNYHCLIYYIEDESTHLFTDSPDNLQKYLKELDIDTNEIDIKFNFVKNNKTIYGNQCRINNASRLLIWIFKDPSKFTSPMIYKQGKYIMDKVYLMIKSQNRSRILDTLIVSDIER